MNSKIISDRENGVSQKSEKVRAVRLLLSELEKGRRSGEEEGYLTSKEVEAALDERFGSVASPH